MDRLFAAMQGGGAFELIPLGVARLDHAEPTGKAMTKLWVDARTAAEAAAAPTPP